MSLLDIVLVSKDELFRRHVLEGLLGFGLRVGESCSMADGLELTALSQPHVLVIDWDTEGAKKAIERFQRVATWAEIILVSVSYDFDLRAAALRAGVSASSKSEKSLLEWVLAAVNSLAPPTLRAHL